MTVKEIVKEEGGVYYFPHNLVKQIEAGEVVFKNKDGDILTPSYFGAGMNGMNGTLRKKPEQKS